MHDAPSAPGPIESLIRRDRALVLAALIAVAVLAWLYTIAGIGMEMSAWEMTPGLGPAMPMSDAGMGATMDMGGMAEAPPAPALYLLFLVLMWWLMMIAMMLPSAAPTILLAAALNRRSSRDRAPFAGTAAFVAGYLGVWLAFSLGAALLQAVLERAGLVSSMMASTNAALSGALLIAAGLWQWTPLKHACLQHCRAPHGFLVGRAGGGAAGAVRIGIAHGAYCLGCCWGLMALLFVGGVMNLYWIAGLALLVLIEKLAPAGHWLARILGAALMIAGVAIWIL